MGLETQGTSDIADHTAELAMRTPESLNGVDHKLAASPERTTRTKPRMATGAVLPKMDPLVRASTPLVVYRIAMEMGGFTAAAKSVMHARASTQGRRTLSPFLPTFSSFANS